MSTGHATWRPIRAAALADFRQRVRSDRFLVVLILTLLACAYMLPPVGAGYVVMQLGEARGLFGSAWIGFVFGAVGALILPLLGFYLVKDSLQRDRDSRVGTLLAATPLSSWAYVCAKFLSNAAVFGVVLGVAMLMAPLLQWWRGEDLAIRPLTLVTHTLLIAGPVLLAVAALAVLFESVAWLRGALGNVLYFFLWVAVLSATMMRPDRLREAAEGPMFAPRMDVFGLTVPLADFEARLAAEHPGYVRTFAMGVNLGREVKHRLPWPGVLGNGGWVLGRLGWCLLCLPLLGLAARRFDRFDPSRGRVVVAAPALVVEPGCTAPAVAQPTPRLTPLPVRRSGWRPLALLGAELRLLLRGQRWWWYSVALGGWIAALAAPLELAVRIVVPLAWFWALTCWSHHGARAALHDTERLLATAVAPIIRQLPVQWLAALLMGVLLVAPLLPRLLWTGELQTLAQLLAGAGFVAALALACGTLSRGPRLFELLFPVLVYASLQKVPGAAFAGVAGTNFAASAAPWYAWLTVVLLGLTALRRRRSGR